jgi:hypothetical protein
MRVVIDASIDPRIVEAFPDYEVNTLFDLCLQSVKDNVLVRLLQCDVFITADRGFEHQHNLSLLRFGIVVVHVERNKVLYYRPIYPDLRQAVAEIRPCQVFHVPRCRNFD